jgi:hypothetical protein
MEIKGSCVVVMIFDVDWDGDEIVGVGGLCGKTLCERVQELVAGDKDAKMFAEVLVSWSEDYGCRYDKYGDGCPPSSEEERIVQYVWVDTKPVTDIDVDKFLENPAACTLINEYIIETKAYKGEPEDEPTRNSLDGSWSDCVCKRLECEEEHPAGGRQD